MSPKIMTSLKPDITRYNHITGILKSASGLFFVTKTMVPISARKISPFLIYFYLNRKHILKTSLVQVN